MSNCRKAKVEDLRKKLSENNLDDIKSSRDALQKEMFDVSTKLYQQSASQNQQSNNAGSSSGNSSNSEENVYDADYKDMNNDGNTSK